MDDFQKIYNMYTALKAERAQYMPLWQDISKFVGIGVDPNYVYSNYTSNKSNQLDEFVDDPTSALSTVQAGEYLIGIMWGTGDKVLNLVPSRYVTELTDQANVQEYYDFITDQTLYHMNHAQAGLSSAMRPYAIDQFAFGTSGIGSFPNMAFKKGLADNALFFRNYGVDNICIDEGKNGQIEIVFAVYQWRTNRIVSEFCTYEGEIDDAKLAKLPKEIQGAWESQDLNREFNIVCGIYPREDYDPKLKGKRGAKYKGSWFLDSPTQNNIFYTEDYAEKPISVGRAVKVRGQIYGRASGTMLLSTIRSVNFMVSTAIEVVEKMSNPSLGIFSNALFGDGVLDTSPSALTAFNPTLTLGQNPVFPIHDIGDPSGIVEFLVPYLNDKVTTAFKVDALLDFNSAKDMTATESLQRYAIRGKSLSTMLGAQKAELLEPLVRRCVSILWGMNELGVNAVEMELAAKALKRRRPERIIPDEVLQVAASGRPWFEIKFNNELEKLTRTEAIQNLVQFIQATGAIMALYPQIAEAVDWYTLLKDINDNLDANSQILISADEFKAKIEAIGQQQQAMAAMQAGQVQATTSKDQAQANKANTEARGF